LIAGTIRRKSTRTVAGYLKAGGRKQKPRSGRRFARKRFETNDRIRVDFFGCFNC